MAYLDLREFIAQLKSENNLLIIDEPVSPYLEITAFSQRVLQQAGPALIFSRPKENSIPALTNLFGTVGRVAKALGINKESESLQSLRDIGNLLALLKEPTPPRGLKDIGRLISMAKSVWEMSPKMVKKPVCQYHILTDSEVDLTQLPIQHCWPEDAAPLITWGLTITRGPNKPRQNLGIYRQQLIDKNKLIVRWLAHRGGALDFLDFAMTHPGQPFPIAVALGADPATILAAVTPIPDTLSEYQFAGLLRGTRTELSPCLTPGLENLKIPSRAEIILEGFIYPKQKNTANGNLICQTKNSDLLAPLLHPALASYEHALEGPFGDHTGYYNEQDWFPVLTVEKISMRDSAIYHSTYTGKPPDEPAILGEALNEVFVPLLQKQYPEIIDFYLPPEGCSYRLAIVQITKRYPGHARRIMFGIWGFLRQFMYTKFIIVVDDDVSIRNWKEVIWAITTRVDPMRDTMLLDNTPIDYLDFASPAAGLGSKMGIDATNKWPGETQREWGKPIVEKNMLNQHLEDLLKNLGF